MRTRNPGPTTPKPRTRNPRTQDPGPRTLDPGPRTEVPGFQDPGPKTHDPKLGTLKLWTFLLNFQIKRWKVRNNLQVSVITQSTLSHIFTFTYIFQVKVCFWDFQETSGYRWFLFKWFILMTCFSFYPKQLEKEVGEAHFL